MFEVRVNRPAADVVVVVGIGEIDSVTAPKLSATLHRELEHVPAVLILDLTGVHFLGVAGLPVLDCALARAETLSVTLNLVHHDYSAVQSALRAAAMTGLFPALAVSRVRPPGLVGGEIMRGWTPSGRRWPVSVVSFQRRSHGRGGA